MSEVLSISQDPEQIRRLAQVVLEENQVLRQQHKALEDDKKRLEDDKKKLTGEKKALEGKKQSLEDEIAVLLKRISELVLQLATATQGDKQLQLELEIRTLRERLAEHANEKYGSCSERRDRPDDDDAKAKEKEKEAKKKKKKRSGPTPQPCLPFEEVPHVLDPADCICPKCGGALRSMAHQFEESELIVAVKRMFELVKHKRQKYHCGDCGHIDTALGPLKLIPGGRYDVSFVIQVALDKYLCHIPLERQVQRMKRAGLKITRQTLWDQLVLLYMRLLPISLALHDQVLKAPVVHADETGWRMMGKGPSKRWWLWSICTETAVCYMLEPSRGSAVARRLFRGYEGIVVADGYTVYRRLAQARTRAGGEQVDLLTSQEDPLPDYTLAICWMHARRPLFKAEKNCPEVKEALDLIAGLYAIEAQAKKEAEGDPERLLDARARLREAHSRGLIDQLRAWRDRQRPLPKSQWAKGVTFLKNQWDGLTRFLEDPRIPLDNGTAERSMRGPVLGRKNFYGCRSERGARVAALMYTVLESCKRAHVDPYAYLTFVLQRMLENPKEEVTILPTDYARRMAASKE